MAKEITKKAMAAQEKKIISLGNGQKRPIPGVLVCECPAHRDKGIIVHVNLIAGKAKCHLCGVETNVETLIRKLEEGDDD